MPLTAFFKQNTNHDAIQYTNDIHFNTKKNYTEDEIFNSKASPQFLKQKRDSPQHFADVSVPCYNDPLSLRNNQLFQGTNYPIYLTSNEAEDEIERVILQLNKSSDYKTKAQIIKKLVSYYKKNLRDDNKISAFYMKLSSHISESVQHIKQWIKYELNKFKVKGYVLDIPRKIAKVSDSIDIHNMNEGFNTIKSDNLEMKIEINSIYNKLNEMNAMLNESILIESDENVMRIVDAYNPAKTRKKMLSYKGKLIKKVIDIFKSKQKEVNEQMIENMLFKNAKTIHHNNVTFNSIKQPSILKLNIQKSRITIKKKKS